MTFKRGGSGQDEGIDIGGPGDDTPVVAQVLRAGVEVPHPHPPGKAEDDRMSIFWRVFGGTILSIVALVAVTLYNNLNSGISELRADLNRANEARAAAVVELRNEQAKSVEARGDLVRKDEYNTRFTTLWDRMQGVQTQTNAQAAAVAGAKTEVDGMKERLTKQAVDAEAARKDALAAVDALKKDQNLATETIKKDVAALEVLRERVTQFATDMKSDRDEIQKLRAEVDRNQAYDKERKDRRDTQYKQIEETFKELQKGVADCREKLARMEGQYGPPSPVAPVAQPKKVNVRPAPSAGSKAPADPAKPASDAPEAAPLPSAKATSEIRPAADD